MIYYSQFIENVVKELKTSLKNGFFTKILFFFGMMMFPMASFACTTVILSGKATKDGRPLMWKNCDTDNLNHSLIYSNNKGYPYLGIARNNSTNENTASVWIGTNSEGFSIMNTLSYNLTEKRIATSNGSLMRKALELCKTVPDFKNFLDTLSRPLNVEANYGVIDAEGNAAYFETYADGYYMVDVNDPAVAPNGCLVYTNFSYNGFYDKGEGYIRYQSAWHQLSKRLPSKDFSPQWIFNNLARSYYHSLLDVDFTSEEALNLFDGYIHDTDLIPRKSTASATVIQGVRKGENPELTTMWVALGYPPCSVAIPAWVKAGKDNPSLLLRSGDKYNSKMCDRVLALKENLYDVERGHGSDYILFSKVFNKEGTGYMQRLAPVENRVFEMTNPMIDKWRQAGSLSTAEVKILGKSICSYIESSWPEPIN
jgi:predicted choloylglycine hydrolase